jgi:hypothetical protein
MDIGALKYFCAFVIILSIVFVEDIDIFYDTKVLSIFIFVFLFTTMFICNDNLSLGVLIIVLCILIFVRYQTIKQYKNQYLL